MENTTPSFHPLDYVSVLRRRMWWLITPVVIAAIVGAALVTWLPREYKSAATLGVAIPSMSQELLNNQRTTPEERMRNIRQVLLSQPLLERVVREEGFDKHMAIVDAANLVRSRLELSFPKPDGNLPPGTIEQFQVAYKDSSPEMTQRVANRVADVFVEESSRKREVRAEETSAFINKQVQASLTRLSDLEGRLRVAKEQYMGALPEQTTANVAMVTGLQQQFESVSNQLRGEQERLTIVESQINALKSGAANIAGTAVPTGPSAGAANVVRLERELAAARGNYTDKHPEIVRLREELSAARAAAAAEASRPEAERVATLRMDPEYKRLLTEQQNTDLRINELKRNQAQISSQIASYRQRVDLAPRVEQQIATVQREYDLEREQYGALTTRLRNAEMQENLVRNRGGEEFAVLTRAAFPSQPDSPNAQRLMMLTLFAGLCLGGALALGREYLDRSIHDSRALTDIDLPVLGEIPRIANA